MWTKADWDFRISDLVKNPDGTVNFGEVRRTQLAKSTLLTSTLVPLGPFQIFKVCRHARERERESRVRKATGCYRTYLYPVKLQPWFLSLQWKTCLWTDLQPLVPAFVVKDLPLGRTL